MNNVHNQVKDTPQLIYNFIQENLERNAQPVTQIDYLTKRANAVIYEDIGVAMEYIRIINIKKHILVWIKYFAN